MFYLIRKVKKTINDRIHSNPFLFFFTNFHSCKKTFYKMCHSFRSMMFKWSGCLDLL